LIKLGYCIDAEKLLRIKGILEPLPDQAKQFETKKEELENFFAVGSSYLQESLDDDQVNTLNRFMLEYEKTIEVKIDPITVNYRESLFETFRDVQDPFKTEIDDLNYS
jgi:hypothetical protein